jgi:putative transposase
VSFHRRRLPHWQPEGRPLFVTWRLWGSLPEDRYPSLGSEFAGRAFEWIDRCLDEAKCGPVWLGREDVARVVVDALAHGARTMDLYELHAYVVMSNHVHLLVNPHVPTPRLMQSIKGYTGREANRILGRTGEPFWQHEYFDHWIRDDPEFERVRVYVENNPVRSGIVSEAGLFPWSSGYAGLKAGVAG